MPASRPSSEPMEYFPDEVAVALCLYGAELEPAELTALLGTQPTHAHRKGDRKSLRSPQYDQGAWIKELRRFEPIDPDKMFEELFAELPREEGLWSSLASRFEVQVHFAVHTDVGCTFNLSPKTVGLLAARRAQFQIYIQAYGDNAA